MTPVHVLAEARRVCRRFGALTAVDATDLAVGQGEVVGLLGANGAGKTTLIRLLLGVLRPSGGTVRLFGAPPSARSGPGPERPARPPPRDLPRHLPRLPR